MIRHYEKLGLIPAAARQASGYREYGDDDVLRLGFIARARRLGFDMTDIADFMSVWRGDGRKAVAARWRERLAEKAADLEGLARELSP